MRVPGALLLFATLTAGAFGQTSRPISDLSKRPKVDLRLIASKTAVRIGASPVILRVELWNEGTRDFWTSRALVPDTSGPAYLMIYVENGKHETVPLDQMDAILSDEAVNEWWTCISPAHYYGLEFKLDPLVYAAVRPPGKYKLTAKYVSKGGLTPPSPDWHVHSHRIWEGTLESNPVWIEVLPHEVPRSKK